MRTLPLEQARGSASHSPEYLTISSLTSELVAALRGDLISLSVELQSTDPLVLTDDVAEEVINRQKIEAERAAVLVRCIKCRVLADRRCYKAFVEVLQKKTAYYRRILEQLEEKKAEVLEDIQRGGTNQQMYESETLSLDGNSTRMQLSLRSLCYFLTVTLTLAALCFYMFTDHIQLSKLGRFAYSPGGTYLLPLSPVTIVLYGSITLEAKEATTVTSLYLLDYRPTLKPSQKVEYQRSYNIYHQRYRFWYYYLYPGSNFSVNICVNQKGPMEAFMLKGTDMLDKWLDDDEDFEYELYHERVAQCPNVTYMKYSTRFEDLYFVLAYNDHGNESVLVIEYTLERHKYLSDGLEISPTSCRVTTGVLCTTYIPFAFEYKYVLITVSIPVSVDWTENVEAKVAYSLRKEFCLMLICMYVLLCRLLWHFCFVLCHA